MTGANRGIGEAITRELSQRGFRVVPTSRTPLAGHTSLDVTEPESIGRFVESLTDEDGVDCLVNNAGASFQGFDEDVAKRTLDVNFFGPLRLTDAILPKLRTDARIVMVSSGMGTLSHVGVELRKRFEAPRLVRGDLIALMESFVREVGAGSHARHGWPANAYSVSKVGLNALVRVLARELAGDPRRILVNAADPGWVRTRMGGAGAPRSVGRGAQTPVWLATLAAGGPTGGFFRDEQPIAF